MRSIKDKVVYILDTYENTRNSDKYLYAMFLWDFHREHCVYIDEHLYIKWDVIFIAPNYESIIRIRQKLQEKGMFLPTDDNVATKRRKKEINIRSTIITDKFDTYLN